jgi:anaerobic selenocysteine-containing dehydrogenase
MIWKPTHVANLEPTVFKNVCPLDCPDTCSMRVTVQDGVAIDLKGDAEHAFTRGFLCRKMARYLDRVYSPDRLMFPMKRVGVKGAAKFERISWDEALEAIATRFAAIAAAPDGPQAILPHSYYGTMGKLQASSLDRRFFHRLGASKLDRTICASAGSLGYEYTMGRGRLGADPLAVSRCKLIVNWGSNTVNTNSHHWSLMVEARKTNGATIVTVDPYRSPTASRSDWHIAARPGTDAALELGLMHVIWREGLQDEDYLSRATIGAGPLRQRALGECPPERVASITGVDVATIETFARRLAREQPSLIGLNRHLLEQALPGPVERQQHDLVGADGYGGRGDVL